jgi:hypothetical protein
MGLSRALIHGANFSARTEAENVVAADPKHKGLRGRKPTNAGIGGAGMAQL